MEVTKLKIENLINKRQLAIHMLSIVIGGIIGLSNENIVIDGCRNAGKLNVPEYALKGDIFASDKGLFNKVADN